MKGEQFVKLPRDLLKSDAFRCLGVNAFRVVHFLMLEHLRHGGRENGNLKAPQRQLVAFGIGAHQLTAAICEAEERGLIECQRHGMRVASTYALTWLPLHDGSPAMDAWQCYRAPAKPPKNLPVKKQAALPVNQQAGGANLPVNQQAVPSQNLPVNQQALSRKTSTRAAAGLSETDREATGVEPVRAEGPAGVVAGLTASFSRSPGTATNGAAGPPSPTVSKASYSRCGFRVVTPLGDRICGLLAPTGSDLCVDHAWRARQ